MSGLQRSYGRYPRTAESAWFLAWRSTACCFKIFTGIALALSSGSGNCCSPSTEKPPPMESNNMELRTMEVPGRSKLEQRVYRAADAALARQHYVSAIDVLCGMGLLASDRKSV